MRIVQDWRIALMQAHERLFGLIPGQPARSFGNPLRDTGWEDTLGADLHHSESRLPGERDVQIRPHQIEVWCIQDRWDSEISNGTTVKVFNAIDLAVARSVCTCDACGAEGRRVEFLSWPLATCTEHAFGDPEPVGPSVENIRILRRVAVEPGMFYARYDRQTDTYRGLTKLASPEGIAMAEFRRRACGKEGTFAYDSARCWCPICNSTEVRFAIGIEEMPDGDPLIETIRQLGKERRGLIFVLLWVLSDLHLELTRGWDLPPAGARPRFDVMIVAGDLVPRMERGVAWLRERVTDRPVLYVAGNHEGYGCDVDRTIEKARQAAAGSNVSILQNDTVRIGNVTFAGATLWTDFNLFGDQWRGMRVAGDQMNCFHKIRAARYVERFRPQHALARHTQSRAFLEIEMRKPRGGSLVVVTHHAPHPGRSFMRHRSERLSDEEILTAAYRSDLTSLMWPAPIEGGCNSLRPADLWIYGHTHESEDVTIGYTRVVSNAKGYGPWTPQRHGWDNPSFDPNFVIEI